MFHGVGFVRVINTILQALIFFIKHSHPLPYFDCTLSLRTKLWKLQKDYKSKHFKIPSTMCSLLTFRQFQVEL